MKDFEVRLTPPIKQNKNYYSKTNVFYPSFVDNCTWYCWGRQLELGVPSAELKKNLPTSNAENWYHDTKYQKCSFARVGDIICYSAGKRHHAADGEGHIAIVEIVYPDKSLLISESGSSMKFKTRIIKPPYKFYLNFKHAKNYKLDGFIHIQDYTSEWVEGIYQILKNKYVRTTPEVNSKNKVKYKNLDGATKLICVKTTTGYAQFKKGKNIYLTDFKYDDKGNLWGKVNK